MKVALSNRSQELLQEYLKEHETVSSELAGLVAEADLDTLVSWLSSSASNSADPDYEVITASLCAELLKDLRLSLPDFDNKALNEDDAPEVNKSKFILLVLAGSLVAACEGFDGVTTILGVFALPALAVLAAGLAFSVLSIVVFCGFDLIQVSRNLGISIKDTPELLDNYVMQLNEIKFLRRLMESYCLAELSADKLREMALIISMLQMRLTTLTKTSNQFDAALNSTKIKIIKSIFAGMAGLLFFGGGFFAGQSVAVFMAALFITSIPTFWPIVVFSTLVGLAAFAVYWYIERPVLQKLISSWFGLDEEKIEQICDTSKMEKEESKLGYLNSNVAGTLKLKLETVALSEQLKNVGEEQKVQIRPTQSGQVTALASDNRYSFHRANSKVNQNNDQDYGLDLIFSA